jgi:predicted DNA-binding protein YlxM (UPF0122 family)
MEEKIRFGSLFDFYGELLGEQQRRICEATLLEDLSLSEIAAELGMSRQGVHAHLMRGEKALEEYESRLHLYEKFLRIEELVRQIDDEARDRGLSTIVSLSEQIMEEL